jgi:Tfp pilus assembly protein PilF
VAKWIACSVVAIDLNGVRNQTVEERPDLKSWITVIRRMVLIASSGWIAYWAAPACAQTNDVILIKALSPGVEILPRGAPSWTFAATNQPLHPLDRVRTPANGFVVLLWSDQSVLRFGASTELEIRPPDTGGLHLLRGILSFFHRGKPGRINVITSGALAGIEGTEFVMEIRASNGFEATTLSVLDGRVSFSNEVGDKVLTNGQQAVAEPGQAPILTSGFIAKNLLQWCFYYPGVLDLRDLPLTAEEKISLGDSLAAYRNGDLRGALMSYPATRKPASDAERIYHAALLLGASQVAGAEADLSALVDFSGKSQNLAGALRMLVAAVKRQSQPLEFNPQVPTECLAASYFQQSRAIAGRSLQAALNLARQAVSIDTNFGFGWERVAELEFSFGRIDRASEALHKALDLSPRNAQALALNGFLLAAENETREAIESFDRALAVDSALGNGWLGRGLCRIRRGDVKGGREDLLIAAAMEPQRAALRSYLAKAWSETGDDRRAFKELQLAKALDPNDPTAWLYSALLDEQENRLNEAVGDLEKSQELNTNRSVYRSQLLLDQDSAVRSANLARIYQEEGMDQVAMREAARAENEDYVDYSAHLFLANSYNALRDPNQINLRYETPTYVEYLVGNLLAPANAGVLSPSISQQEYSRLFERDSFGVNSESQYLSRGAWTESGAQYGTTGDYSYDLEGYYRSDPGQRANNDIEQRQLSLTIKQQLTPKDMIYGMALQYEATGGDLRQYYYQTNGDPGLRTHEEQSPLVVIGYHHEWQPSLHTLFLVGRLQDTYQVQDTQSPVLGFAEFTNNGPIQGVGSTAANQDYSSEKIIYTSELQQIWQYNENTFIGGLRFQDGDFKTHNNLYQPQDISFFPGPPFGLDQTSDENFERFSAYGYYLWRVLDSVQLTGGLSYDWMTFPQNFQASPTSNGRQTEDQVSPKAGVIWTPFANTVLRADYTRSLAGASLEQSFQLEPSQVAGFNQLFRSLIPESIEGENAGARFETWGLSLEQKMGRGTFFGLSGQMLNSLVNRQNGVMILGPTIYPSDTPEHLDFHERDVQATLDQLVGKDLALGLHYQLTDASLLDEFTQIPVNLRPIQSTSALLHQIDAHARFNHPNGCFAEFQALWNAQQNYGYSPAEPGDDFWQFNVVAGYRFLRNHAEFTVGLLNLSGRDYKLNPLTTYNDLPRTRTLLARLKLDF